MKNSKTQVLWFSVLSNEVITAAADINNAGVIIGSYQDAAGVVVGFMATP